MGFTGDHGAVPNTVIQVDMKQPCFWVVCVAVTVNDKSLSAHAVSLSVKGRLRGHLDFAVKVFDLIPAPVAHVGHTF